MADAEEEVRSQEAGSARWEISGTRYQNIIHNVHGTKNPHHTNLLIEDRDCLYYLLLCG